MAASNTQGKLIVIRPDMKLFYFGFDALISTSMVFISLSRVNWLFNSKKILTNEIAVIRSWVFFYCQNMAKGIKNRNHSATKTAFEAGCMNIEENLLNKLSQPRE